MKAGMLLAWVAVFASCLNADAFAAGKRVRALGSGRGYDQAPYFEAVLPGGSMTTARAAIEADGFTVSPLEAFGTTDLVDTDIVFLGLFDPSQSLITRDRIGLLNFVLNGGALIYMGDNDQFKTPNASVGGLFGVTFKQDPTATSASHVVHQLHPIIRGPAGTVTQYDAALNLPNFFGGIDGFATNVTPVLGTNDRTFVAVIERDALQPGSGPVIFISEANGFMNTGVGTIHLADNLTLWRNIFAYASGSFIGFCVTAGDCSDGLFCNGTESCIAGQCIAGDRPCPDSDGCHETTDSCGPCTADDQCADNVFCDGAERCMSGTCQPGTRPCAPGDGCHEDNDTCGPCETDIQCDDALFCNGAEMCLPDGRCDHGPSPCEGECDECDESTRACSGCLLDLDRDDVIGTGDFAQFAGCFGACYPANDPCLVTNFDGSIDGCVGTGDFAALAGCFGGTCTECTNCSAPAQNAASGNVAAATSPVVMLRLVALPSPSTSDAADSLPLSANFFQVGHPFYVELWATNAHAGGTGLAAAYVDVEFDPGMVGVQNLSASRSFALFAEGDVESRYMKTLGGCALLGQKSFGADPAWVRVATARVFGTRTGASMLTTSPAGNLFGVAMVGEFGNLQPIEVSYGSITLQFTDGFIDGVDVGSAQQAAPLPTARR